MRTNFVWLVALAAVFAGCAPQQHSANTATPSGSAPSGVLQPEEFGWYLVQPPVNHGNADTAAKLYDWQELGYFEHAAECDKARQRGLTAYPSEQPYIQAINAMPMNSVKLSEQLASASLCVAATDPRLVRRPFLAKLTSPFGKI